MFRDRQVGGGGAMHGSKMKECQVVCQLLLHWWCWRLSDWPPLRPTTTSAEQTRPVFAVLCRQSNQLHNPLRGIILISLRGVLTEEAAAAASISAILQVFRTWAAKMWYSDSDFTGSSDSMWNSSLGVFLPVIKSGCCHRRFTNIAGGPAPRYTSNTTGASSHLEASYTGSMELWT